MTSTTTNYNCDRCGEKLNTCDNELHIATMKDSGKNWWSKLTVTVRVNKGTGTAGFVIADLCQSCAILLLADALCRVQGGERTTAGTESSEMRGFI